MIPTTPFQNNPSVLQTPPFLWEKGGSSYDIARVLALNFSFQTNRKNTNIWIFCSSKAIVYLAHFYFADIFLIQYDGTFSL